MGSSKRELTSSAIAKASPVIKRCLTSNLQKRCDCFGLIMRRMASTSRLQSGSICACVLSTCCKMLETNMLMQPIDQLGAQCKFRTETGLLCVLQVTRSLETMLAVLLRMDVYSMLPRPGDSNERPISHKASYDSGTKTACSKARIITRLVNGTGCITQNC